MNNKCDFYDQVNSFSSSKLPSLSQRYGPYSSNNPTFDDSPGPPPILMINGFLIVKLLLTYT